jgi:hypothetical protein
LALACGSTWMMISSFVLKLLTMSNEITEPGLAVVPVANAGFSPPTLIAVIWDTPSAVAEAGVAPRSRPPLNARRAANEATATLRKRKCKGRSFNGKASLDGVCAELPRSRQTVARQ